jgi:glycosyltransferase involved in cell wall biosynthesis
MSIYRKNDASLPLVTIITPSYNQVAFLEYTIQSVLLQDYPHIEYMVVDGGSNDCSVDIIRKYAGHLAWWVSERDKGQGEAINKGLERAQGEIIAWLNSDDIYLPGAISGAVKALQAHPKVGLVFGDALTIDAQGNPLNILTFDDWGLDELLSFRIICQPTVFMRREILQQAGFLDKSYHFMLDHHLWLRMANLAPLKYVPEIWAAARQHDWAKNVNQAVGFALETHRLWEWIQNEPQLHFLASKNRQRVEGGVYRLEARYLLDSGATWPALKTYLRAMLVRPGYTLKHWHRMLYAVLVMLGFGKIADRLAMRYFQWRTDRQRERLMASVYSRVPANTQSGGWPGLAG